MTVLSAEARTAVMDQLSRAHEEIAEIEQELAGAGYADDARVAGELADKVARAYAAEIEDPKPDPPKADCLECAVALRRGRKNGDAP